MTPGLPFARRWGRFLIKYHFNCLESPAKGRCACLHCCAAGLCTSHTSASPGPSWSSATPSTCMGAGWRGEGGGRGHGVLAVRGEPRWRRRR